MTQERDYDQTQLKMAQFKYQPHKDYLGHIFRWGFASKFVNGKTSVLDVGCGQEMPFARSLGGANPTSVPREYLGVDLNKIKDPISRKNFAVRDEFNFVEDYDDISYEHENGFDVIVNFEVFEHMKMAHGRKLLKGMRSLLAKNGVMIFSTPIYCSSYRQARNHINELTKAEIEDELHRAGFKIIKQYGTFSNINDIKKVATPEDIASHVAMSEFYGNEILGCYLSPKYPEASRNITHICVRDKDKRKACKLKPSIVKFEGEKAGPSRDKK
jgi:SAM-dependent methyltransferase